MLKRKDVRILSALRGGSRRKLAELAREAGLPLSTLHERLQRLLGSGELRPVPLLDFAMLRLPLRCLVVIKAADRHAAQRALSSELFVNSVWRVGNGADLVCDAVFPDYSAQHGFLERLSAAGTFTVHPVISDVCSEQLASGREL